MPPYEAKPYNSMQYNDRLAIQGQTLHLANAVAVAVEVFVDDLPISSESNQLLAEIRDKLSDLLLHVRSVRQKGGER